MILLLIFSYLPMAGMVMAFQNFVPAKGIFGSKWVGLEHFVELFSNRDILLLIYPLLQRYLISGMVLGAVKE